MKLRDLIRRAWRSLGQAKARTFLTALAIAVGAFTLTLAIAAGEGARQYANALLATNVDESQIIIAADDRLFSTDPNSFAEPQEYDEDATQIQGAGFGAVSIERLTAEDLEAIAAVDGLAEVRPLYEVIPQFVTTEGGKRYSASIEAYNSGIKPELAAGQLPQTGDIAKGELVLPDSFVQPLGFESPEAAIGKEVIVQLQQRVELDEARIQEIIANEGSDGLADFDPFETTQRTFEVTAVSRKSATTLESSPRLLVSDTDAREMTEYTTANTDDFQKYLVAYAQVPDADDDPAALSAVQRTLEAQGYDVQTAEDAQALLFQLVNILQGIVVVFGILALIASVFGIINTQYISVLERTSQIGLMKALGMKRADVSRLFRIEAALIGLLGGLLGAGAAIGVGLALNPFISESLGLGDGTYLLIFQPLPLVLLIAGLMLVAVIAGLLPARKAAKLNPIEALRTE